MNINIIAVGTLKKGFWRDAYLEYEKRVSKYANLKIFEVKETDIRKEGSDIIKLLRDHSFKIMLDIEGIKLSSVAFSSKIDELSLKGIGQLDFVIGGSLGLSEEVLTLADLKLSFSDMTFTYQLARVILVEQLYRAFKIRLGEKYHK